MLADDFVWRSEWALRTALTAAVLAAVVLFTDVYGALQFRVDGRPGGISPGGPQLAGFICMLVADVNFGRTLINIWNVAMVTIPCLLLTAAPLASGSAFSAAIGVPCLACSAFLVQLLNLHPVGKRVGLSVLAYCLIQGPSDRAHEIPLALAASVLFGLTMSMVGLLLPWPKLAAAELGGRQRYVAGASRDVLHSLLAGLYGKAEARSSKAADQRRELLNYVQRNLSLCQARIAEARCGPCRRRALNEDAALLRLLDEIFMSAKVMNGIFSSIDFGEMPLCDELLGRVRPELSRLDGAVAKSLEFVVGWSPGMDGTEAGAELRESADAFNGAFTEARRKVLFSAGANPIDAQVLVTLYTFLFEVDLVVGVLWAFLTDFESVLQQQNCCRGTLANDLFPSQRHLRDFFRLPLKPHARTHLVVAFKLTLAMVVAAMYGYFAFERPNSMAAYTIAYVGVEAVQGSNMSFSLLRSAGTLAAGCYAELIVRASANFPEAGRRAFALAAITLFTVPATYIRSSPAFSYGGNVAAFTCVILLFNIPSGSEHARLVVQDRISETIVGVAIFVLIDLFVLPMRSESQLYGKMTDTLRAVREEVSSFGEALAAELGPGDGAISDGGLTSGTEDNTEDGAHRQSSGSGTDPELGVGQARSPCPRDVSRDARSAGIFRSLPSHAQRFGLITAQRALLQFSTHEPDLWHVGANRDYLSSALDVELGLVLMSLQLTRIMRQAVSKSSRLAVPTSFEDVVSPAARVHLLCPINEAFEELLSDMGPRFEHLIDGIEHLNLSPDEVTRRRAIAGFAGLPDEDKMRSDVRAMHKADARLQSRFDAIVRGYQEACLGAELSGSGATMPPSAAVKAASALVYATRGVLRALSDMEAPLVRAHAARVLAGTQRPLSCSRSGCAAALPPLQA